MSMNKKSFLNSINYEDKTLLANLYDKILLCEKTNKTMFSHEFYPPVIWNELVKISNNFSVNFYSNGIFEESERKMICISVDETVQEYPIKIIKITNKSKFKELKHKDFLGTIMSLGIVREKIGDLKLQDNICYAAASIDVIDYIKLSLDKISNCPCDIEILDIKDCNLPKSNFEEKIIITTSIRADCFVSSLCNLSRNKVVDFIKSGKILVNYMEINKKDKNINIGDVVTVRGYGKYKIFELIGTTQRDRKKFLIKKYT